MDLNGFMLWMLLMLGHDLVRFSEVISIPAQAMSLTYQCYFNLYYIIYFIVASLSMFYWSLLKYGRLPVGIAVATLRFVLFDRQVAWW